MLFLKLISPNHVPRKKTNWKFHHKFYQAMLKLYLSHYYRGVIEDRIVVNEVVTIHSVRDPWFEKELKRFGIEIEPTLCQAQMESFKKRKYHRYRTFNWEDKLTVIHYGKKCTITRDDNVGFDTNMVGQLQSSSDKDAILSIFFNGYRKGRKLTEKDTVIIEEPKETSGKPQSQAVQPKKKKIHIKDAVKPYQEKPVVEQPKKEDPPKPTPQESYTKHAGFEENDIF